MRNNLFRGYYNRSPLQGRVKKQVPINLNRTANYKEIRNYLEGGALDQGSDPNSFNLGHTLQLAAQNASELQQALG